MARRKTVKQLQADLEYATNKAAYTAPKKTSGAVIARPRTAVRYSRFFKAGLGAAYNTIDVSTAAINFFGGIGELGLEDFASDDYPPRGFHPGQIKAAVSTNDPTIKEAKGSKRPYDSYRPGGNNQYTFVAALTASSIDAIVNRVKGIATAKKADIGPYGRIYFHPERLTIL